MLYIILGAIGLFLLLFIYCACVVSSRCSREEEKRELLWQQQEYGKLKKD